MNAGRGRQRAYSDLLTGLIDLGPTTASDRFDDLLTQARAAGQISDDTARVLRWWQREALRAQADHVLTTAPTLLAALDQASGEALESAHRAERSWEQATGGSGPVSEAADHVTTSPNVPSATTSAAEESAKARESTSTQKTSSAQESATPQPSLAGRHRGIEDEADTPLFDQMLAVHDPAPKTHTGVVTSTILIPDVAPQVSEFLGAEPTLVQSPRVDATPDFAPDPTTRVTIADRLLPADAVTVESPAGAPLTPTQEPVTEPVADVLDIAVSARRRRLLVAGLTVINEELNRSLIADPP